MVCPGDLHFVAREVNQLDLRTDDLGRTAAFRINHDHGRQTGHLVDLLGHRQTFFDVLELGFAGELGNDGASQRIPVREDGASLDGLVGFHRQNCTVRHFVTFALATMFVVNDDLARAGNHHQLTLAVGYITHRGVEADVAVGLGLHAGGNRRTRGGTTNVEGAHGQLRTRFANGLRGNDADGLTPVDQTTTAQIAAIAPGANTKTGLAGQRGTHLDLVDADSFQLVNQVFIQHGTSLGQHGTIFRVQDLFGGGTPQNTVTQGFNDLAAFNDGAHLVAAVRAAILFGDNQILRHIDQTPGQVTRIRCFQCSVRQTFSGAVGGDEVLQHVQPFTEICGDWRFDDGAIGLGHQPPHTGYLTNLGSRTTRAGIRHHVDGIERLLLHLLTMAIGDDLLRQLGHHDLGDFIAGLAPDVDHFVVALTGSHQTGCVLLPNLLDLGFGAFNDALLFSRDEHVVNTDRNARFGCQAEAVLQQLVRKNHCLFQAAFTE